MKNIIVFMFFVLSFTAKCSSGAIFYDGILSEEVFDMTPRFRRDTRPGKLNAHSCCNFRAVPNLGSTVYIIQCERELKLETHRQYRPNISDSVALQKYHDNTVCIFECIFKKAGFLTNDDKFTDKLSNETKKDLQGLTSAQMDTYFGNCQEKFHYNAQEGKQCSDRGMMFIHCMRMETELECPTENQRDRNECRTFQQYLKDNRFQPPTVEDKWRYLAY